MHKRTKLWLIVVILLNTASFTSYSQNIDQTTLRDINHRLLQGLECKDLMVVKNKQLVSADSLNTQLSKKIDGIQQQNSLLKQSNSILSIQVNSAVNEAADAKIQANKAEAAKVVEKRKKKFWRSTALGETAILVGVVCLFLL